MCPEVADNPFRIISNYAITLAIAGQNSRLWTFQAEPKSTEAFLLPRRGMRRKVQTTLLGIALLIAVCNATGAGFNCKNAHDRVEKIICSNSELSELDTRLSNQFAAVMAGNAHPSALRQDQRKWLEERNRCDDTPCIHQSYARRIAQLESAIAKTNSECPVKEKNIIGSWRVSGAGDFEEMEFEISEGRPAFISWLHHQPEMAGTWSLKACNLHIAYEAESRLTFNYTVKRFAHGSLYLQDEDGVISVYRKLK